MEWILVEQSLSRNPPTIEPLALCQEIEQDHPRT